jgi:hypothetical protein
MAVSARLDLWPLVLGGAVGAAGLVAAGGLGEATSESALAVPLLILALTGLGAAGWIAARRCRHAPLVHAASAALLAVVAVGAVGVLRLALDGDEIPAAVVATWLLLAVAAGTGGGLAALQPSSRADSPG